MRIVCAGAGPCNLAAALNLKKSLPKAAITLIHQENYHTLYGHLPELVSGKTRLEKLQVNLEQHLKKRGIEFIGGAIDHLDRSEKIITVGNVSVHYDYLLLDAPSVYEASGFDGAEKAYLIKDTRSLLELRQHIVTEIIRARNTNLSQHKTFVVAGAGVSGIELISELKQLTQTLCEQHLLFNQEVALVLLESGRADDVAWSPVVAQKIRTILEDNGIEYYAENIQRYGEDGLAITDRVIETETLVWTVNQKGNRTLKSLGLPLADDGALAVNQYLQTNDPAIFALGACARVENPVSHHRVPKTSYMAFDEEKSVTENIVRHVAGKKLKPYKPKKVMPLIITTGEGNALLVWGSFTWHGKLPYRMKQWAENKYTQKV